MCSFVQDCSLLNHFLSSYQKNYTPNLESIEEAENILEDSRREYSELCLSRSSFQEREHLRRGSRSKRPEPSDYQTELAGKFHRKYKQSKELENNSGYQLAFSKVSIEKQAKKPALVVPCKQPTNKTFPLEAINLGVHSSQEHSRTKGQLRSKSPLRPNLVEKQSKVKTITRQAVQRILDGINLQKGGLNNIITIQGSKPSKDTSSKNGSVFPSKKNSTNLVTLGESQKGSRASSRKSTSTKSKGNSPLPSPAHTSHTAWCNPGQPLNIKIENKDFIAKLMNINIIKIKPDLRNNACFCRASKEKPDDQLFEKRKPSKGQSTSVESKNRDDTTKIKPSALRNRSASERSNDHLSKRRPSKNKKLGLISAKLPLSDLDNQK